MSNWTHVAGIIRIDDIRFGKDDCLDFDKVFGKSLNYYDLASTWKDAEEHPENYMPMGSEGSLRKMIYVSDQSEMAAYAVGIFGDLRDHDDPDAVVDWFKEICRNNWVRNAVIEVANEFNGVRVWSYNADSSFKEEV